MYNATFIVKHIWNSVSCKIFWNLHAKLRRWWMFKSFARAIVFNLIRKNEWTKKTLHETKNILRERRFKMENHFWPIHSIILDRLHTFKVHCTLQTVNETLYRSFYCLVFYSSDKILIDFYFFSLFFFLCSINFGPIFIFTATFHRSFDCVGEHVDQNKNEQTNKKMLLHFHLILARLCSWCLISK